MKNPGDAIAAASRVAPAEACGVTVGGRAVALTNVSPNPRKTFRVNVDELRSAIELNDGLWDGVWHSHPNGMVEPSEDDVQWHPPGKALYIVAQGLVYEYDDEGGFVAVHGG